MSKAWPGLEVDQIRVDYRLELSIRHNSIRQRDQEVFLSVALQDGDVLVAASCLHGRNTEKESKSKLNSQGCPKREKKIKVKTWCAARMNSILPHAMTTQLTSLVLASSDKELGLNKTFSRFPRQTDLECCLNL